MSGAIRSTAGLIEAGLIAPAQRGVLDQVAANFGVSVTPAIAALIDPADPADPIARQFIPHSDEQTVDPAELADPIGDETHSPVPGLVHRYADRVLLKVTSVCPVYCRFCFRREMIGPDQPSLDVAALDYAADYIASQKQIWEVILTGGDPLILSPRRLAGIRQRLDAIDHLGVLRLHSRVPVVDPSRVDDAMVAALRGRLPVYVLLHANHPREFTAEARAACARLVDAGIPMLGQSVLLRGVNDDAATLTALFRAMIEARVKPHYLHHGDLARGTGHFRTTIDHGQELMRALRGTVSGLCQPTYLLDIPGGAGKVPIGPGYLDRTASGWRVEDPSGGHHPYPPVSED